MQSPAKADEEVPVLIAGGGGAGLTASMLLARLGVRHLLVSTRSQTSDLPKASATSSPARTRTATASARQSGKPQRTAATSWPVSTCSVPTAGGPWPA
jgi:2-polyprenyl-6-methoxyphenol hydroxylase-like FAD-dependent oxidoreductase